MAYVFPHIIPKRSGCTNLFSDSIDTEKIDEYIREKRAEGLKGFGVLHIFIAGYVRAVSQRPGVNRFVANKRLYARNTIDIMMTVKKELALNAEETCIKITPSPYFTAKQVFEMLNAEIKASRDETETSSFDKTAKYLNYVPGFIMRFAVGVLRLLDKWDWLPKGLIHVSPFHGSMFLTSLGSLGIPPVNHHLYDFGNIPMFIAYGMKRKENVINSDGSISQKTFIDYTITTDDRVCDGHYYASTIKLFKSIIENPWQLDEPPKQIIEDVD